MGNTADVGPEIGSGTAKYANVRCDMIFANVGGAPRNPLYLLITWRSSGRHVELPRFDVEFTQSEKYEEAMLYEPQLGRNWSLVTREHHLNKKKSCSSRDRVQMLGVITTGPTGPD